MSRNDRNILILGLLGIVLLAVGYYFLLLSPLLGNLDQRAQERSDKEAQLARLQQQVRELERVQREAPDIERQLLELSKRIPTQPEVPSFVVQIEEISQSSGVTQLSVQPGTPEPPPGGGDFFRIPITMSFEGTYEDLQDFLFRTRNLARLVTVNEINYEPAETEDTTAAVGVERLLQVEIQAEIYFQPSGVPEGAAPVAPAPPAAPEQTAPATDQGGATSAR